VRESLVQVDEHFRSFAFNHRARAEIDCDNFQDYLNKSNTYKLAGSRRERGNVAEWSKALV
jgi:hypothetical protein